VYTGTQWRKIDGSGTYTFSNGLTNTSGAVTLGGTLTGNTSITGAGYSFGVSSSPLGGEIYGFEVTPGPGLVTLFNQNGSQSSGVYLFNGKNILIGSDSIVLNSDFSGTNYTKTTSDTSANSILAINKTTGALSRYTGGWASGGGSTIDTSSLSNRINLKLSIADTSAMLSPYLRSNVAAATYQPIGNYDTATVVKAYVTNAESVTITKGQVVYIFGASGDRASVKLAKNTSDTFSSKTLGIVREDIAAGQRGWITTQGQVSGINLGAYTPGDILWLDSIPGSFTSTKPQAPYHAVFLGVVERANVGNGLIYVKPQNGVELDELHDVKITSLANNDVIRYNSSLGYWENKSVESILQFDTIPLVSFGAGSGAAGDTSAFTTSAVYGSFYNDGSDTLIITQMRAGVLGTSPSITTEIYWNDSLNITAGATILVSGGTSVTGTIGATNVTSFTNNKIPPGVWVFCRTSAVATKPTYFTLTLLGYKKRK
jgi:hypothetical protein